MLQDQNLIRATTGVNRESRLKSSPMQMNQGHELGILENEKILRR